MSAAAVLGVLDLMSSVGAQPWVDGGWGVDALLGEQTRPHQDVDMVVGDGDVPEVRAVLEGAGFTVIRDLLPAAVAYSHPDGREVDLHPVTLAHDGGGDQKLAPDAPFHYGPPVGGVIAGRAVLCVDTATQLRAHCGYPPTRKDRVDVLALVTRFGLEAPTPYRQPVSCGPPAPVPVG